MMSLGVRNAWRERWGDEAATSSREKGPHWRQYMYEGQTRGIWNLEFWISRWTSIIVSTLGVSMGFYLQLVVCRHGIWP